LTSVSLFATALAVGRWASQRIVRIKRIALFGVTLEADFREEVVDPGEERKRRIERLTDSLRESASLLTELESDIAFGQSQAAQLDEEISKNTELAKLSREQASAVRDAMGDIVGEVVRESDRKAFWQQLLVQIVLGAIFFAAGVVATLIFS
jgi:hypothetical protein